MMIEFFMPMNPPRTTAQQKRVGVSKSGKQIRWESGALSDAHQKLLAHLAQHAPAQPFDGAVGLLVKWIFLDQSRAHVDGEYKITRPDTDNLQKMLKDCMSQTHFWHDDAQVASEHVEKFWSRDRPGIYVKLWTL